MSSSQRERSLVQGAIATLRAIAVLGTCVLCLVSVASAQPAPPQAAPVTPPQAPAPQQAPQTNQPGFVDTVGRWLQEGKEKLDAQMKGAREALGEFHDKAQQNAKEAAGALVTNPHIVDGRARCEVAANGGPDCATAAATVCRGKNFQTGKSVATQTEQKCSARVLLSGRSPAPGDCKVETYVTRAVCQ
jgi:hypothetical protein